jgi:hypothetical protein
VSQRVRVKQLQRNPPNTNTVIVVAAPFAIKEDGCQYLRFDLAIWRFYHRRGMGGRGTRAASRRSVYDVEVKQHECDIIISTEAYGCRMDVINRGLGAVYFPCSFVALSHIGLCRGLQLGVGPHSVPTGLPCVRGSIRNVTSCFIQLFATKEAQRNLPTVRLLTIWWGELIASDV